MQAGWLASPVPGTSATGNPVAYSPTLAAGTLTSFQSLTNL